MYSSWDWRNISALKWWISQETTMSLEGPFKDVTAKANAVHPAENPTLRTAESSEKATKRNRNCQNRVGNSGHSINFYKSQAAGWYTSLVYFILCNHCSLNVFDTLYQELKVSRSGIKMQGKGRNIHFEDMQRLLLLSVLCGQTKLGIFELSYGFALNKTSGFAWKSCLMLGK